MTRDDGRYTITVQPGTYTVRVIRLGFSPDSVTGVVVTAGGETTANFSLQVSAAVLGNVVIVGYGTQEARNRTGVVASVDSSQFNTGRIVSPEQLITAKVAGVQVVTDNEPGGGINIRIRGGTSVTSSSEPLFVLDGVPLPAGGGAAPRGATRSTFSTRRTLRTSRCSRTRRRRRSMGRAARTAWC